MTGRSMPVCPFTEDKTKDHIAVTVPQAGVDGYLVDQFLQRVSNKCVDIWGAASESHPSRVDAMMCRTCCSRHSDNVCHSLTTRPCSWYVLVLSHLTPAYMFILTSLLSTDNTLSSSRSTRPLLLVNDRVQRSHVSPFIKSGNEINSNLFVVARWMERAIAL